MAETKPFWMSDEEWGRRGLPKLEGNVAEAVTNGVPDLTWVEHGHVVGAYTRKDGMLVFHFYKRDRKAIFDEAHRQMAEKGADQKGIADAANEALEKLPWWPQFKGHLDSVFKEQFRYQPFKTDYYSEVDSWSVIMPEPAGPLALKKERLEAPFVAVASLVAS